MLKLLESDISPGFEFHKALLATIIYEYQLYGRDIETSSGRGHKKPFIHLLDPHGELSIENVSLKPRRNF